jgi:hypothetical protein
MIIYLNARAVADGITAGILWFNRCTRNKNFVCTGNTSFQIDTVLKGKCFLFIVDVPVTFYLDGQPGQQ